VPNGTCGVVVVLTLFALTPTTLNILAR